MVIGGAELTHCIARLADKVLAFEERNNTYAFRLTCVHDGFCVSVCAARCLSHGGRLTEVAMLPRRSHRGLGVSVLSYGIPTGHYDTGIGAQPCLHTGHYDVVGAQLWSSHRALRRVYRCSAMFAHGALRYVGAQPCLHTGHYDHRIGAQPCLHTGHYEAGSAQLRATQGTVRGLTVLSCVSTQGTRGRRAGGLGRGCTATHGPAGHLNLPETPVAQCRRVVCKLGYVAKASIWSWAYM